jgi:hypothetical protein
MESKHSQNFDLKIQPIKTSKDKIKQNELMKAEVILKHPHSCIFNGSTPTVVYSMGELRAGRAY